LVTGNVQIHTLIAVQENKLKNNHYHEMESEIIITVPNPSKPVGTLLKHANLFWFDIISLDVD